MKIFSRKSEPDLSDPVTESDELLESKSELGFGALSGVKRAVVTHAASAMLAASRKTADLIISRYRPQLMLDAILDPSDIRRLIEDRDKYVKVPAFQLVVLATHSFETLPLARSLRLTEFADDDSQSVGPMSNDGEQVDGFDSCNLDFLDRLLRCVTDIESGNTDQVNDSVNEILKIYDEFNHPLIARFMSEKLDQENSDPDLALFWCRRALVYWPLDQRLLEMVSRMGPQSLTRVVEQIKVL